MSNETKNVWPLWALGVLEHYIEAFDDDDRHRQADELRKIHSAFLELILASKMALRDLPELCQSSDCLRSALDRIGGGK